MNTDVEDEDGDGEVTEETDHESIGEEGDSAEEITDDEWR